MRHLKKLFALSVAMLSIATAHPLSTIAAVTNASAYHLADALTKQGEMTMEDDYNGDRIVNGIDLTLLKRALLQEEESGEVTDQTIKDIAGSCKLIGRTLDKNDVTWLVQSGSAVECTVTGTKASVTIAGDGNVYSDAKYRPRYAVYVDDELLTDVVMGEPEQTVQLFSGTANRTATVKIIHLSEANNGAVGVKQFDITSGASRPVKPTAKKDLSIEFIGDSITCAYGVEADSQYVSFETGTENFTMSYAYLTAGLLNADYSAVSYSGHGIISGYTNDGSINTDSLVPDFYTVVGKPADYQTEWDFNANPNDVVVINLGTNDNTYLSKDYEGRGPSFTEAYVDFLTLIREKNPDAHIICTVGTMGCAEVYPYIEEAVAAFGDAKVSSYLCATQDMTNDGLGADWHPSPVTHQKSAYVLADKIADALGIPWDEIGLDAASDRTYEVTNDTAAGVYVSSYVNTYDNSLNVGITTGGDTPEAVQAFVSGLSLIKGEYELKLTCNVNTTTEVPYRLRSLADPDVIYLEGTLDCSGGAVTIQKTIAMTGADECEFVFDLGGKDSYQFNITAMTMFKIS